MEIPKIETHSKNPYHDKTDKDLFNGKSLKCVIVLEGQNACRFFIACIGFIMYTWIDFIIKWGHIVTEYY